MVWNPFPHFFSHVFPIFCLAFWKRQESVSSAGAAAPKGGQRSLGRPGVLCESPIVGVHAPNQGVPSGSLEDAWSRGPYKVDVEKPWDKNQDVMGVMVLHPSTLPRSYWTQNRLVPKIFFLFINHGFVWGCLIWIGEEMKLDVAKPWGKPVSKTIYIRDG